MKQNEMNSQKKAQKLTKEELEQVNGGSGLNKPSDYPGGKDPFA